MFAKVELTKEIRDFINITKDQVDSFDTIKIVAFSEKMKNRNYSTLDVFNYSIQFQRIKSSAYRKVLSNKFLNYPEGIVFERLLALYMNEPIIPLEQHHEIIKNNCLV